MGEQRSRRRKNGSFLSFLSLSLSSSLFLFSLSLFAMARDGGVIAAGSGGVSVAPAPPHAPGTTSDVENEQRQQEQQQRSTCRSTIGNAVGASAHCSTYSPPAFGASVPLRRPVRMLLIDNYDSYTYNLFQLMSMVNGGKSWPFPLRVFFPVCHADDDLDDDLDAQGTFPLSSFSFSVALSPPSIHPSILQQRNPTCSTTTPCPGPSCGRRSSRKSGTAS